jgi:hypothetical protein
VESGREHEQLMTTTQTPATRRMPVAAHIGSEWESLGVIMSWHSFGLRITGMMNALCITSSVVIVAKVVRSIPYRHENKTYHRSGCEIMPRCRTRGQYRVCEAHEDHPDHDRDCAPASYLQLFIEACLRFCLANIYRYQAQFSAYHLSISSP